MLVLSLVWLYMFKTENSWHKAFLRLKFPSCSCSFREKQLRTVQSKAATGKQLTPVGHIVAFSQPSQLCDLPPNLPRHTELLNTCHCMLVPQ